MRTFIAATMVLAFVGLASTAKAAEDPAGTWKVELNFGGKTRESTLKIKLDGEKLTGVYVGGQNNTETPIENGSYKDGKVSFTVTREFNGNKFTSKYTGTVNGDTMKGKTETEINGETRMADWEAKRQK